MLSPSLSVSVSLSEIVSHHFSLWQAVAPVCSLFSDPVRLSNSGLPFREISSEEAVYLCFLSWMPVCQFIDGNVNVTDNLTITFFAQNYRGFCESHGTIVLEVVTRLILYAQLP